MGSTIVGPIWQGGQNSEKELLTSCYKNCLKLAIENNIKTIAFPSIITGAYGFPIEKASKIALDEIFGFSKEHNIIEVVKIVCFGPNPYNIYMKNYTELTGIPF